MYVYISNGPLFMDTMRSVQLDNIYQEFAYRKIF